MRIVVWNCALKLAGAKLMALENLQPDVAIVPACACPDRLWGNQPLLAPIPMQWVGANENKGLGVFAFNGYRIWRHADCDPDQHWLLPVEITGPVTFHLLAVWATTQRIPQAAGQEATGRPLRIVERYRDFLAAAPSIVAGDFQNNVRWDRGGKASDHAALVAGLERLGLASAYHFKTGQLHGQETAPTSYGPTRSLDGPHCHVEYCFLPVPWCSRLRHVELGGFDAWCGRGLSDHVPLIVDVDLPELQPSALSQPETATGTTPKGLGQRIKRLFKR